MCYYFSKYCAYGLAALPVELILWMHNHLYSYIDEHMSDFARIGSSSEGPGVHHCGKAAYTCKSPWNGCIYVYITVERLHIQQNRLLAV